MIRGKLVFALGLLAGLSASVAEEAIDVEALLDDEPRHSSLDRVVLNAPLIFNDAQSDLYREIDSGVSAAAAAEIATKLLAPRAGKFAHPDLIDALLETMNPRPYSNDRQHLKKIRNALEAYVDFHREARDPTESNWRVFFHLRELISHPEIDWAVSYDPEQDSPRPPPELTAELSLVATPDRDIVDLFSNSWETTVSSDLVGAAIERDLFLFDPFSGYAENRQLPGAPSTSNELIAGVRGGFYAKISGKIHFFDRRRAEWSVLGDGMSQSLPYARFAASDERIFGYDEQTMASLFRSSSAGETRLFRWSRDSTTRIELKDSERFPFFAPTFTKQFATNFFMTRDGRICVCVSDQNWKEHEVFLSTDESGTEFERVFETTTSWLLRAGFRGGEILITPEIPGLPVFERCLIFDPKTKQLSQLFAYPNPPAGIEWCLPEFEKPAESRWQLPERYRTENPLTVIKWSSPIIHGRRLLFLTTRREIFGDSEPRFALLIFDPDETEAIEIPFRLAENEELAAILTEAETNYDEGPIELAFLYTHAAPCESGLLLANEFGFWTLRWEQIFKN